MRVGEYDKARIAPSDCRGPETTYAGGDASGAAARFSASDASNDRVESAFRYENCGAVEAAAREIGQGLVCVP